MEQPEPDYYSERITQIYSERITQIEKCVLHGKRPRNLGCNARISAHGSIIRDPLVRVRTSGGGSGIGWSSMDEAEALPLLGQELGRLFTLPEGCTEMGKPLDLVFWDLYARMAGMPLYRLLGSRGSREVELYDGSIYIDDLEADDDQARAIFAGVVRAGWDSGYRNFKIKIGRGARWMATAEGLARDELVVRTVREAAGPDAKIMIDANMGNTLNTAIDLLSACADVGIYWFEEPFAEDPALNQALKKFLVENGFDTLVADGEFSPPPYFFDLVKDGWIDVVQHDFRALGLTWWRATSAEIEPWGARCAPHCWGSYVERYCHAHFAASIPNFELLEGDQAYMPGLIAEDWKIDDGKLRVPDTPGSGFDVEPDVWESGVADREGFRLSV